MLTKRIMAEIIDIFVFIISLALALKGIEIIIENIELPNKLLYVLGIIALSVPILLQCLFWKLGKSIGKTYVGLLVIDNETQQPANFTHMFIREVFSKWLSLYIVCIPVLFGNKGIHELTSNTTITINK